MVSRRSIVATIVLVVLCLAPVARAQHSVARVWNEALLDAIRNDLARPTVHARNLCHLAVAMYDAWAAYDDVATTYFLNGNWGGHFRPFAGVPDPGDVHAAREEAISFAAYRLLVHRFQYAPETTRDEIRASFDQLMMELGYDASNTSTDYASGDPAALGNFIGTRLIEFGLSDGSNEADNYSYEYYAPVNPELDPLLDGNPSIVDPNRWQPLKLSRFIGQAGFPGTPAFVGPEWGEVVPFSLPLDIASAHRRDGYDYVLYHDPGAPPTLDPVHGSGSSALYQETFALVAVWSGHLDPTDGVMWDISPATLGNIGSIPTQVEDYDEFYTLLEGGDPSVGHDVNPHTGLPYEPQLVPRGDYTRVLAEFWADGPDSETPPGHWFTILNYVVDHPEFERRYRGEGPVLDPLEWDVKAYFALGGAVHDAAVTAWGIKGWYDYVRPVSAIRAMADLGQCTDPERSNYHPAGIPLVEGAIEIVEEGDPLAGASGQNVGKIKLRAWRGPLYILTPATDTAGVAWILAEKWWPYQRPTFVSPPFAGYISGHSTFSRAAAEVLTLLTGDPFFPGGMGEFVAPANEFLVFEDGPSVDVTLQWATYRDASDQTSLSRIWGGIHPPVDDLPGRHLGIEIAAGAFALADNYFQGRTPQTAASLASAVLYPNPAPSASSLVLAVPPSVYGPLTVQLFDVRGRLLRERRPNVAEGQVIVPFDPGERASGVYFVRLDTGREVTSRKVVIVR